MNIKLFKYCRLLTVYIRTSSMVSVLPIRVFEFEIGFKLPTNTVQIALQLSRRILFLCVCVAVDVKILLLHIRTNYDTHSAK